MQFYFVDKQNKHYRFYIESYDFSLDANKPDMGSAAMYSITNENSICCHIMRIIKNDQNEFIVQWNESIIKNCSHIIGFKECIDKTVKLLVFS